VVLRDLPPDCQGARARANSPDTLAAGQGETPFSKGPFPAPGGACPQNHGNRPGPAARTAAPNCDWSIVVGGVRTPRGSRRQASAQEGGADAALTSVNVSR
jgi:hypothetical protein